MEVKFFIENDELDLNLLDEYSHKTISEFAKKSFLKNIKKKLKSIESESDEYRINGIFYKIYEVPGDGDCFFHTLQKNLLIFLNFDKSISELRNEISQYIIEHKEEYIHFFIEEDIFDTDFILDSITSSDSDFSSDSDCDTDSDIKLSHPELLEEDSRISKFIEYYESFKDMDKKEWADNIVINAAQDLFDIRIEIYELNDKRFIPIDSNEGDIVSINNNRTTFYILYKNGNHYDCIFEPHIINKLYGKHKYKKEELKLIKNNEIKQILILNNIEFCKNDKKSILINKYINQNRQHMIERKKDELNSLQIKNLKLILNENNISSKSCKVKKDYINLIIENYDYIYN